MNQTTRLYTLALVAMIAGLLLLSGCLPRAILNSALPGVAVVARPATSSQVPAAGVDAHFVKIDDYFIMEQTLADQSYVYSSVAKMQAAPSPDHDNEARFLRILDSQQIWTSNFAKTRVATSSDLTLNKEVFFLNLTDANGNYRAPASSTETSSAWWLKARIADISHINQGYVRVTGGLNVNVNALRVAVR
jgi:hypothetical protein